MKVLELDPRSLRANPWNSNVVSSENQAKLDESVRRLGMFKPIVVREVDGEYEILGGAHRVESALRLGLDTVPVVNLGTVDDKRAKQIGLVDNGRYGADDALALADILQELGEIGDLALFMPYSEVELETIFASKTIELDDLGFDESDSEIDTTPIAKKAQTHQVMRFKVPLADAVVIESVIKTIMKRQGFEKDDSLTNAGDALVWLAKRELGDE